MKFQARFIEVSRVAVIPFDGTTAEQVRKDAEDIVKNFPEKLNFRLPKKGEDIKIEIEQVG